MKPRFEKPPQSTSPAASPGGRPNLRAPASPASPPVVWSNRPRRGSAHKRESPRSMAQNVSARTIGFTAIKTPFFKRTESRSAMDASPRRPECRRTAAPAAKAETSRRAEDKMFGNGEPPKPRERREASQPDGPLPAES